jgi:hypothetical protein
MAGLSLVQLLNPIQVVIAGDVTPKGAYDEMTDYTIGDLVSFDGTSYIMYSDAPAGTAPTDTTKWGILAAKGSQGDPGAPGEKGDPGDPGAAAWGTVGGTLSDQTDLWEFLSSKANQGDLDALATGMAAKVDTSALQLQNLLDVQIADLAGGKILAYDDTLTDGKLFRFVDPPAGGAPDSTGYTLTSPNGTNWRLTVDDDGALITTEI